MNPQLQEETRKLIQSWAHHEAGSLRDYLVAGVEDPRINVQSILSRHFLVTALFGEPFQPLMAHELRFAAAMNWLIPLLQPAPDLEELQSVLYALQQGADNAEGIEIPPYMAQAFAGLPSRISGMAVPHYIERFLRLPWSSPATEPELNGQLDVFMSLWKRTLATAPRGRISVLEPACGSANDYRFLAACGLSQFLDYTGFDLCESNIRNALAMFPAARFEVGNAFAIQAEDKSCDVCFFHDLLEHLSPEGMQNAVREICRVTRKGICAGFFNMDEISEHHIRPVEDYHWNTLSMQRTCELFAEHGFTAQAIHIGAYLHQRAGCPATHNENAYTFLLA